jgi:RPA family protein
MAEQETLQPTEERKKRQVAYVVSIGDVIAGEFVKVGGWEPNFVKTPFGLKVSRVNLIGTILEKKGDIVVIDDTTGIITIRSFGDFPPFGKVNIGDYVMIIGKVRQFNEEIYVMPELCKKIERTWHDFRLEEIYLIKKLYREGKIKQEEQKLQIKIDNDRSDSDGTVFEKKENDAEKIIRYINENDKGSGVSKNDLLGNFLGDDFDNIFNKLINDGDIFEIKPGVFKILK